MIKKILLMLMTLISILVAGIGAGTLMANAEETCSQGHDYLITAETLPTCTAAGSRTKRCSRCGDETVEELAQLNHNYVLTADPEYLHSPASCTGSATYFNHCTLCFERGNGIGSIGSKLDHIYEVISETKPSCKPGVRISRCARCATRKTEEIPATSEHVWEREDVLAATCTETGLWQYVCPNCGETKSGDEGGVIQALGHDLTTQTTAATCTTRKTVTSSCTRCDYRMSTESGNLLSHAAERRVTLAATCTTGGTFETVCKNCSGKIGEGTIEALGHDYSVTSAVLPTCTTAGSRTSTCSRCNDAITETLAKRGHAPCYTYSREYLASPATCENSESYYYHCNICGEILKNQTTTNTGTALGHNYVVIAENAASCKPSNRITRCTRCLNERIETIPATGEHVWGQYVIDEATCTTPGVYDTRFCSVCGLSNSNPERGEIEALGHDYAVTAETAATCTTAGSRTSTCSRCNDEVIEELPAIGHNYTVTAETAATCTAAGSRTRTCANCHDETIEEIPATGHNYENGSCTVCGTEKENPKPDPVVSNSAFDFLKDPDVWILIGGIAAGVVLIGVAGRRRR